MRILVRGQGRWEERVSPTGERRFMNPNRPERDPDAKKYIVKYRKCTQNFHATIYALDEADLRRKLKEDKVRGVYGVEELPPHTVEKPDGVMIKDPARPDALQGSNLYVIDNHVYRQVHGGGIARYEAAPEWDERVRAVLDKKPSSYGLTVLEVDLGGRSPYRL